MHVSKNRSELTQLFSSTLYIIFRWHSVKVFKNYDYSVSSILLLFHMNSIHFYWLHCSRETFACALYELYLIMTIVTIGISIEHDTIYSYFDVFGQFLTGWSTRQHLLFLAMSTSIELKWLHWPDSIDSTFYVGWDFRSCKPKETPIG